jgi:hypothetical protein
MKYEPAHKGRFSLDSFYKWLPERAKLPVYIERYVYRSMRKETYKYMYIVIYGYVHQWEKGRLKDVWRSRKYTSAVIRRQAKKSHMTFAVSGTVLKAWYIVLCTTIYARSQNRYNQDQKSEKTFTNRIKL